MRHDLGHQDEYTFGETQILKALIAGVLAG